MLETRVAQLEEKIQNILEKVAPMKTKTLTQVAYSRNAGEKKRKVRLRKKASRSEKIEDEHKARQVRNESAKEIKNARLQCLKKKAGEPGQKQSGFVGSNRRVPWLEKTCVTYNAHTRWTSAD